MPNEQKVTRKLKAILSADVKGYSLLMADDETHTIQTLKSYRGLMSGLVQHHSGRVVDAPGDNLLAEFSSAVDAVECSVEIQKCLKKENNRFVEDKRLQYRIGINIGDVVHDGDRIYGSGVNVAARIEGIAEPGGICISQNIYSQIKDKVNFGYEYLGEHEAKNIKDSVRVYKVLLDSEDAGKLIGEKSQRFRKKWPGLTVAVVSVLVGIIAWQFYYEKSPPIEAASVENMAFPLPDKPSIAVLPFVNMSGDPEQEYFSDGMTEDLITDLSKISGLFVIGRNSTFTYKGKPIKIRQVAEELGVRYVLEGSIRKAESTVRINAQLIDAITGGHVWAERYDEQMKNIFSIQDKITQKIVETLAVKLTIEEMQVIPKKETENLEAYLTFLKGWQQYRLFNPDAFSEAISFFEKAIDLDPNYWHAYAALAKVYLEAYQRAEWRKHLGLSRFDANDRAQLNLKKAMNGPTALAHTVAAELYFGGTHFQESIDEAAKAVSLDSNDPDSHFTMGLALIFYGRHKESVGSFKRAMRLDPFFQDTFGYGLGMAYFFMTEFEKSVNLCKRSNKSTPENDIPLWFLSAAYAHLGSQQEAETTLAKLRELNPEYSYLNYLPYYFRFKDVADYTLLAEGLRKAGM